MLPTPSVTAVIALELSACPVFTLTAGGKAASDSFPDQKCISEEQAFAPEDEEELKKRKQQTAKAASQAADKWRRCSQSCNWNAVVATSEVYRFAGLKPGENPRVKPEYVAEVLKQVNLGDPTAAAKAYPHLSAASLVAVKEVIERKAASFWLEGTPRTTVKGFVHDVLTKGPPVRGAPMRLKGQQLQDTEDGIQGDLVRGQLERGNSPWGS